MMNSNMIMGIIISGIWAVHLIALFVGAEISKVTSGMAFVVCIMYGLTLILKGLEREDK